MKISIVFLSVIFLHACAAAEPETYTGSTPANAVVRSFLNIPMKDSVDFIRWRLQIFDKRYVFNCNYGISKPNTSGFIDGGKKITMSGTLYKEGNKYLLYNENKILKLMQLNTDLLYILDASNNLLVGNSGWSYTLNNVNPFPTDKINLSAQPTFFKDSMTFEGRTPCNVPGIISAGMQCYKLKWHIVLYANAQNNETGSYKVLSTLYREQGPKKGNWEIIKGKKGQIIYMLTDADGNQFLNLLKLDEHILVFTDMHGKLLVGNEDFSYTLNRIN